MCVMASSDHSIITIGTFGQWGALLAGGDVVAATGLSQELDTWVGWPLTRDISSPHYIMLRRTRFTAGQPWSTGSS